MLPREIRRCLRGLPRLWRVVVLVHCTRAGDQARARQGTARQETHEEGEYGRPCRRGCCAPARGSCRSSGEGGRALVLVMQSPPCLCRGAVVVWQSLRGEGWRGPDCCDSVADVVGSRSSVGAGVAGRARFGRRRRRKPRPRRTPKPKQRRRPRVTARAMAAKGVASKASSPVFA